MSEKLHGFARGFGPLVAAFLIFAFGPILQAQVAQTVEYVPGEVIVKLKGKSQSLQSKAFVGKVVTEKSMSLKGTWSGLNMHHFSLKGGQSVQDVVNELRADPDVEYAEPNYIVRQQSLGQPEGGVQSFQEAAAEQASADGQVGAQASNYQTAASIDLASAWAAMTPGKTAPVVAVIDTGVDYTHAIFVSSGAIWSNSGEISGNGIDDDGNGYVDDVRGWNFASNTNNPYDDEGHGTHVAGIVLGTTMDISPGSTATAPVKIMPLKFLDSNGSGSTSDAIKAIYYAVNNGAKVLSNSWGGGSYSNALLDAIAYTYAAGRVFVAAAGNSASDNNTKPTYPANYAVPNVISIAATSDSDSWASFSNYGNATVHMASPGVSIRSTYPGGYTRLSGTSMATPFVAGIAALIVREHPTMNGYQVSNVGSPGTELEFAL